MTDQELAHRPAVAHVPDTAAGAFEEPLRLPVGAGESSRRHEDHRDRANEAASTHSAVATLKRCTSRPPSAVPPTFDAANATFISALPSRRRSRGVSTALTAPRVSPRAVSMRTPSKHASVSTGARAKNAREDRERAEDHGLREIDRRQDRAERQLIHPGNRRRGEESGQELARDEQRASRHCAAGLGVDQNRQSDETHVVPEGVQGVAGDEAPERGNPKRCERRADPDRLARGLFDAEHPSSPLGEAIGDP